MRRLVLNASRSSRAACRASCASASSSTAFLHSASRSCSSSHNSTTSWSWLRKSKLPPSSGTSSNLSGMMPSWSPEPPTESSRPQALALAPKSSSWTASCEPEASSRASSLLSSEMRWAWERQRSSSSACSSELAVRAWSRFDRSANSWVLRSLLSAGPAAALPLAGMAVSSKPPPPEAPELSAAVGDPPRAKAMTTLVDCLQVFTRSFCSSDCSRAWQSVASCSSCTSRAWASPTSRI
mmetsp:Transcript_70724/g.207113  ORF Transcript_70724/g.207113 Transcript_70724/m.207113 type:complete len:239 (+) Transcript_70724:276-992(+)